MTNFLADKPLNDCAAVAFEIDTFWATEAQYAYQARELATCLQYSGPLYADDQHAVKRLIIGSMIYWQQTIRRATERGQLLFCKP